MSKIIIITLILAILFLCFPFLFQFFDEIYINAFDLGWLRGEETKEEIVVKYIEGLKTENSKEIKRLVPRSYDADKAIQDKIEKFEEADFSQIEIFYNREEKPFSFQVEIKNIKLKSGEKISDKICVQKDCRQSHIVVTKCNKSYLIMGKIKEKYNPIPSSLPRLQRQNF